MQAVSAATSVGSTAGYIPMRSWLRPKPAVRLGVDDAVGAQGGGQRGRVDRRVEVDRRRPPGCAGRGRRRTASSRGSILGPAVEQRRGAAVRAAAQARPPCAEQPLDLVCEQPQRRDGRRVVGLVTARVLQRQPQVQRRRCHRVAPSSAARSTRGWRDQRQPDAGLAGEGLLRGEVVGVGLRDVDGHPAGGGGGVDEHERVESAPATRRDRDRHARSRSRSAARRRRRRRPRRERRRATRVRAAYRRLGQERRT